MPYVLLGMPPRPSGFGIRTLGLSQPRRSAQVCPSHALKAHKNQPQKRHRQQEDGVENQDVTPRLGRWRANPFQDLDPQLERTDVAGSEGNAVSRLTAPPINRMAT